MERERETGEGAMKREREKEEEETSVPERKQEGREGKEKRAVSREEQEVAEAENDGRRGTRHSIDASQGANVPIPSTISPALFPQLFPRICSRNAWRNLKDWKIFLEDSSRILEKEETYEGGKRERIKREIYFVKEKDKIYLFLFILENLE